MKKQAFIIALLALFSTLQSCAVVGGIFKAGMGVGVFVVVLVIAIIIFFIVRMGKRK